MAYHGAAGAGAGIAGAGAGRLGTKGFGRSPSAHDLRETRVRNGTTALETIGIKTITLPLNEEKVRLIAIRAAKTGNFELLKEIFGNGTNRKTTFQGLLAASRTSLTPGIIKRLFRAFLNKNRDALSTCAPEALSAMITAEKKDAFKAECLREYNDYLKQPHYTPDDITRELKAYEGAIEDFWKKLTSTFNSSEATPTTIIAALERQQASDELNPHVQPAIEAIYKDRHNELLEILARLQKLHDDNLTDTEHSLPFPSHVVTYQDICTLFETLAPHDVKKAMDHSHDRLLHHAMGFTDREAQTTSASAINLVRFLLTMGAEPLIPDSKGSSAFLLALESGNLGYIYEVCAKEETSELTEVKKEIKKIIHNLLIISTHLNLLDEKLRSYESTITTKADPFALSLEQIKSMSLEELNEYLDKKEAELKSAGTLAHHQIDLDKQRIIFFNKLYNYQKLLKQTLNALIERAPKESVKVTMKDKKETFEVTLAPKQISDILESGTVSMLKIDQLIQYINKDGNFIDTIERMKKDLLSNMLSIFKIFMEASSDLVGPFLERAPKLREATTEIQKSLGRIRALTPSRASIADAHAASALVSTTNLQMVRVVLKETFAELKETNENLARQIQELKTEIQRLTGELEKRQVLIDRATPALAATMKTNKALEVENAELKARIAELLRAQAATTFQAAGAASATAEAGAAAGR